MTQKMSDGDEGSLYKKSFGVNHLNTLIRMARFGVFLSR